MSEGWQAAIGHNRFYFLCHLLSFMSSGSHQPQPFGLPFHIRLPAIITFEIVNLVHSNSDFYKHEGKFWKHKKKQTKDQISLESRLSAVNFVGHLVIYLKLALLLSLFENSSSLDICTSILCILFSLLYIIYYYCTQ